MKKLLLILIVTFIVGCTTTGSVMDSWVGKNISDVVQSWGSPNNQFSSNGVTTYTWTSVWNNQYTVNTCLKSFNVNSSGTVLSYSYNNCPRFSRLF